MDHRKIRAEPLIQLDAKTTQQPLNNNSRKHRGSEPAEPATRLAPPKRHGQSNATATYQVANQAMRMFDQEPGPGFSP